MAGFPQDDDLRRPAPPIAGMRQVVNRRFTPRALAPLESQIRSIAREIIDAMSAPLGRCDFVLDVAAKLPTAVICEMMAIPKADRDLVFALANLSIGAQDPEYQIEGDGRGTGQKAQREYFEYLSKVVAGCRKNPGTIWSARCCAVRSRAKGSLTPRCCSTVFCSSWPARRPRAMRFPAVCWRYCKIPSSYDGWTKTGR